MRMWSLSKAASNPAGGRPATILWDPTTGIEPASTPSPTGAASAATPLAALILVVAALVAVAFV